MKYFILFCVYLITTVIKILPQPENPTRFPIQDEFSENKSSVIVSFATNSLMMFWFDSTNRQIKLSKSIDNGVSWSGESIVVSPNPNANDIEINVVVLNSGRILLTYKLSSFYFQYSDDNGLTWTAPAILPTSSIPTTRFKSFLSSLSKLSTNEVVFTFSISSTINISESKGIYFIKSSDGLSWSSPDTIDNSGINGYIFSTNSQKNILVYQDSIVSTIDLFYKTSTDGGISWSERNTLVSNSLIKSSPIGVSDQNGKLWVYYTQEDETPFTNIFQSNLNVITSNDDGVNWTTPENFTKYIGYDFSPSITTLSGRPILSFASSRNFGYQKKFNQIYFTLADVTIDENVPPFMYQFTHSNTSPYPNTPYFVKAFVDDDNLIDHVKLVTEINYSGTYIIIDMLDDGVHNDSLANDNIYGASIIPGDFGETITYYFMIVDNELNSINFDGGIVEVPLTFADNTYLMDVNNLKLPMDNKCVLADANINGFKSGHFEESTFLFSGGFYLSGFNSDTLWANGVATASLINDYQPGPVGASPDDLYNKLYFIKNTDPAFGPAWQVYSHAVDLGADFYDGNNDGIYNPVDLNGNNQWDLNEDRPDNLGDLTTWCVYNDGIPSNQRRWDNQKPLGIEIHQSVFAWGQNVSSQVKNIIFIRYRLINTGSISQNFDSVYFTCYADPDLGDFQDDLVGCNLTSNLGYLYNEGPDNEYGQNPPAFGIPLLQGPVAYIPGETFTDMNGNQIYDDGVDIPLDTAYSYNGSVLGTKVFAGAKNQNMNSFMHYMSSHPTQGDPNDVIEARNYILGFNKVGELIDPCNWNFGQVYGLDCSTIDPRFMYSGDPVIQYGWINLYTTDQRMIVNTGPFNLKTEQPIDIICAYVVGRGYNSLNSIDVMEGIVQTASQIYNSNFTNIPVSVEENSFTLSKFELQQNYPNPFNPSTTIKYQIPSSSQVELKIYDILGKEIVTLVNEYKTAGIYNIKFNASKLSSGVYFYQLKAGDFISTMKMILIK